MPANQCTRFLCTAVRVLYTRVLGGNVAGYQRSLPGQSLQHYSQSSEKIPLITCDAITRKTEHYVEHQPYPHRVNDPSEKSASLLAGVGPLAFVKTGVDRFDEEDQ